MKRFRLVLLTLLVVACAAPARTGPPPAASVFAIVGAVVVDVETGELLIDQTVLIVGNRIVEVAPLRQNMMPANARVVQGHGKYLIPGLWDMHAHAVGSDRESTFLPALVAHGITGVRNMHTTQPLTDVVALKKTILRGERVGPRLMVAGPLVDGPHQWNHRGSVVVGTAEAAARAVDSLVSAGADFIKVYEALSPEAYHAIAGAAARRGVAFAGHLPNRIRAQEAAAAAQRSVEHLGGLLRPCGQETTTPAQQPSGESTVECDSAIASYAKHGTWQVPTLTLYWSRTVADSLLADPARTRMLNGERLSNWRGMSERATSDDRARWAAEYQAAVGTVGLLHRAGVPILAGTDTPNPLVVPGISLHDELELLVKAGLTNLQALRAATLRAAEYFAASDSLGSIHQGMVADLVLLDANPLDNIGNTREIHAVVLNGRYFDRAGLDRLLDEAQAAANAPLP